MLPTEIAAHLHTLGVAPGSVLQLHTSYRAVGAVTGGPDGLIDAVMAVLGPTGTLVMPSWTGDDDSPFDPAATPAARDLGVVAETFRHRHGVVRSGHPLAWAALGPRATEVVAVPLQLPPHGPKSPVGRIHDLDGQVLLLGVGHDANTSLHLAELIAGVPYRVPHHVTVAENGLAKRIDYGENDHCCARFALADDWLRAEGGQREGPVGKAHARLFRARDVVALAVARLARDPLLFLHPPGGGCAACDLARASLTRDA